MSSATPPTRALLIYDGQCAFCQHWVHWITRRLDILPTLVASGEAPLEQLGLSAQDVSDYVWLVTPTTQRAGAAAIAWLLRGQRRWGWRFLGHLLDTWPVSVLADVGYQVIARNRRFLAAANCEVCRGRV